MSRSGRQSTYDPLQTSGRAQGDGTKVTESAQNADFRRKPQIFADSRLLLEIQAFAGRRKPQKTADFRRKPKIFAENRRKPQIGLRHLRSVTFSSALKPPAPSSQKDAVKPTIPPPTEHANERLGGRFGFF